MFPIPYRRQTLVTFASAEKLQQRIGDYLTAGTFRGTIETDSFRLLYGSRWRRDTYQPWILGRFRVLKDSCELEVTYTLHPLAVLLTGILAAIALGQVLVAHRWTGVLFVGVMHCAFYLISFLPQVRELEDIFRTMAE